MMGSSPPSPEGCAAPLGRATLHLSLHTDYGLRLLMHLTLAERGVWVATPAVAQRFEISVHHLQKIAQTLVRAGVVEARQGRSGACVSHGTPARFGSDGSSPIRRGSVRWSIAGATPARSWAAAASNGPSTRRSRRSSSNSTASPSPTWWPGRRQPHFAPSFLASRETGVRRPFRPIQLLAIERRVGQRGAAFESVRDEVVSARCGVRSAEVPTPR